MKTKIIVLSGIILLAMVFSIDIGVAQPNGTPKASPWIQAFIERSFRTLKQEFLNLVWIGNWDKFKDVLIDSKFEYNNRPHSSFGYRSPFETMNDVIINLPQHVCGH